MSDLFENAGLENQAPRPLADRLRPQKLAEVVGQEHLLGEKGFLGAMVRTQQMGSVIFWGPPGSGKTTIARLLAHETDLHFEQISAIFSGVKELREVFERAGKRRRDGIGTLLFVDEIHRFNKSQQDSFLPHLEDGTIVLVGATTENPSFELNSALLSRTSVLTFKRLDESGLETLLQKAERHLERVLPLDKEARAALVNMADGDGRSVFNLVEDVMRGAPKEGELLDTQQLVALVQRRAPVYDKSGEGHYNLVSALHKAIRGSDPQAALYWFARMLAGGEDPLFIARRLVRMAVEDIGLGDPHALLQANAAKEAYQFLGSPEGELALAQSVVYLATAPKSNAVYAAYKAAMSSAKNSGSLAPPKHIINAPTKFMKQEGYGAEYEYDPDCEDGFSGQNYFPDGFAAQSYYQPVSRGYEREIQKRLDYWDALRKKRK
ncbi:MAG: replication-associated recombination protein A [Hyphomicrobiaceae bacterium]|nr:replication-associated recombination protein A [Hyphomicrobiaceae bacterium]